MLQHNALDCVFAIHEYKDASTRHPPYDLNVAAAETGGGSGGSRGGHGGVRGVAQRCTHRQRLAGSVCVASPPSGCVVISGYRSA